MMMVLFFSSSLVGTMYVAQIESRKIRGSFFQGRHKKARILEYSLFAGVLIRLRCTTFLLYRSRLVDGCTDAAVLQQT